MRRVPNPLICSVDVMARKAISVNLYCLNSRKQIPPTTFELFLRIIIDSWFLSNTSLTIYSFGILGNCLAKIFFKSSRYFRLSWFWSLWMTLKAIWFDCSCSFAAQSRATNPSPTFYISNMLTSPCMPTKLLGLFFSSSIMPI